MSLMPASADDLVCWKCGASLAGEPQPLARLAVCPGCRADLHVCLMCEFYDTGVAKHCRETVADEVQNKERANFCGYFQAQAGAYRARDDAAASAARGQLDALFGADADQGSPASPSDAARDALERLFGASDKSRGDS